MVDYYEVEILDVVATLVEQTTARLATERDKHNHAARKKTMIALAPVYLAVALKRSDRGAMAAMLKRPGSSFIQLMARLQIFLGRHLQGDESEDDVQRLVDAWTARRLAAQPSASGGSLRAALAAASAAALAASQDPAVKAAIIEGFAKAKQQIQQWRSSPSADGPKSS